MGQPEPTICSQLIMPVLVLLGYGEHTLHKVEEQQSYTLRAHDQQGQPTSAARLPASGLRVGPVVMEATCTETPVILVDLGCALRRRNARKAARRPLREGMELARRLGAHRLAERAREELAASGARLRREALTGVESLTPSERRVARLAASGRTNREIAEVLFVSRKTVETHLAHIYQKLDTSDRRALATLPDAHSTGSMPAGRQAD